jgi:exosortase
MVCASVLFCWESIVLFSRAAWRDDQSSYLLLILPVSILLFLFERKPNMPFRSAWPSGGALLLSAIAIGSWGAVHSSGLSGSGHQSVTMLALITFWIGAFLLCFGAKALKALYFPLLLLFLMVPLPAAVLENVIYLLQTGSSAVAYSLFRLFGVPVRQAGFVLFLPGISIEIAEQCSGIRSSMALLVTSLALSRLYLRSGWSYGIVAISVLPLAIFKNGLRVFVLSCLAIYLDPSWLEGRLHRSGGVLFFALALTVVVALIAWLRRIEGSQRKSLSPDEIDLPPNRQEVVDPR